MKKTLVALAILAAGSANAFELYNQDGTSVAVKGEVDLYVQTSEAQKDGEAKSKENAHVYTWAYAQIDFEHALNDDVAVFGSFEIEGDGNSAAKFDDVVGGFKGDFGKLSIGETGSSYGALEKAEVSNEQAEFDVVYNSSESAGKGIRFETTVAENLALSADIQTRADEDDDANYAVSADYATDAFSVAVAYLASGDQGKKTDPDYVEGGSAYGISASLDVIENLYLAATFTKYDGQGEVGVSGGNNDGVKLEFANHEGTSMGLAAAYTIDKARIYAAYHQVQADKLADGTKLDDTATGYYVGADYAVLSNVTAYLEYGAADVENVGDYSNVIAGMYIAF
ncbi:porin [Vibrio atypicus]|uniref:porin n=1 Tax=Vibrio atypicus TaxID=558271 RepID=UPI001359F063|nr:porin [Vibrio atypicus]